MTSNGWIIIEASTDRLKKFHPEQESHFYELQHGGVKIEGSDFIDLALKNLGFKLEMSLPHENKERRLYTFTGDFLNVIKYLYSLTMQIHEGKINMYGIGVNHQVFNSEDNEVYGEIAYVDTSYTSFKTNMVGLTSQNSKDSEIVAKINSKLHVKEKAMLVLSGGISSSTVNLINKFIQKEEAHE